MRPSTGACPAVSHPTLHALHLRRLAKRNDTVDLAVDVLVVFAAEHLLAIHPHRGETEVSGHGGRVDNPGPSIVLASDLSVASPSLLDAQFHQATDLVVYSSSFAIILIQIFFKIFSGGEVFYLGEELVAYVNKALSVGPLDRVDLPYIGYVRRHSGSEQGPRIRSIEIVKPKIKEDRGFVFAKLGESDNMVFR